MSRRSADRLQDIVVAAQAIARHLERGLLEDSVVFDAVPLRLIEIGEAVKGIDPVVLEAEPEIPWRDIAGMRDQLAHHYFDASHAIVRATVENDLPVLVAAVERLLDE